MKFKLQEPTYLSESGGPCFVNETPEYGVNYKAGYVFFISRLRPGIVSRGIAWFTRFDRLSAIPVTHTGLVVGPGCCIEAEMGKGVTQTPLEEYFNDPHVAVFFRKPRNLMPEIAEALIREARTQEGKHYDKGLIGAHALTGSYLGRLASLVTQAKSDAFIAWMLDNPELWICSEFMSWVLGRIKAYAGHGVLRYPAATISPQELFEDEVIFERWKTGQTEE